MPSRVYVGTSGWNYRHWRNTIYPRGLPQAEWLGYLAQRVDTLEVNYSFYRIPAQDAVRHWQESVSSRLRFAVKMWRGITHYKKLSGCQEYLDHYFEAMDLLRGRNRGPLLVQLPPNYGKDVARLDRFLDMVRGASAQRWKVAIEFRNDSWLRPEVYRLLDRRRAAICLHDLAGRGAAREPNDASFVYVRRHGPGAGNYEGSYSSAMLGRDARDARRWQRHGQTVYFYFNNDIGGHAFRNARQLMALLANRPRRP